MAIFAMLDASVGSLTFEELAAWTLGDELPAGFALWGLTSSPGAAIGVIRLRSTGLPWAAIARVTGISARQCARLWGLLDQEEIDRLLSLDCRTCWATAVGELIGSCLFWSPSASAWLLRYPTLAIKDGEARFSVASKCPFCFRGIAETKTRVICRICGAALRSSPPERANRYLRADRPTSKDLTLYVVIMDALRTLTADNSVRIVDMRKGNVRFSATEKFKGLGDFGLPEKRIAAARMKKFRQARDRRRKIEKARLRRVKR